MSQKSKVINLYKKLQYLGKDWHQANEFRVRCKAAFLKNVNEENPEKIEKMIQHGEYVAKEIESLYALKKYRALKRRYYREDQ